MTDDEIRYIVFCWGGRYPPQHGKPCKDVMRGGIFRLLGIVSPSKVFRECTFCKTPCMWGITNVRSTGTAARKDYDALSNDLEARFDHVHTWRRLP